MLEFRVWVLGFGISGSGSEVQGSRFRVWGLGFGVWVLGFGVWGLDFRMCSKSRTLRCWQDFRSVCSAGSGIFCTAACFKIPGLRLWFGV